MLLSGLTQEAVLRVVCLATLLLVSPGCASVHPYLTDRWNDAKDVTTVAVGVGIGAKARVGPLWAGLLANRDLAGWRHGCAGWWFDEEFIYEVDVVCYGYDRFDLLGEESDRRRNYAGVSWVPFCTFPSEGCEWIQPVRPDTLKYYGQIEAVVGLGPSIRVGFNPVEFVDFVCGWFLIDFSEDDMALPRRRRTQEDD